MESRHPSRNSLTDLNSLIDRPAGETTRQENIRLSNDPSSSPEVPGLGCLWLVLDLDRFAWPVEALSLCRNEKDERGFLLKALLPDWLSLSELLMDNDNLCGCPNCIPARISLMLSRSW
jgi:hypothetical protein